LAVLSTVKTYPFDEQIMLGLGIKLANHKVIENGKGGLYSAVNELEDLGAIARCEGGGIQVNDGFTLEPYATDSVFLLSCKMLYTAAAVLYGNPKTGLPLDALYMEVREMDPSGGPPLVYDTLVAALCAFVQILLELRCKKHALELLHLAKKYAGDRKREQASLEDSEAAIILLSLKLVHM